MCVCCLSVDQPVESLCLLATAGRIVAMGTMTRHQPQHEQHKRQTTSATTTTTTKTTTITATTKNNENSGAKAETVRHTRKQHRLHTTWCRSKAVQIVSSNCTFKRRGPVLNGGRCFCIPHPRVSKSPQKVILSEK